MRNDWFQKGSLALLLATSLLPACSRSGAKKVTKARSQLFDAPVAADNRLCAGVTGLPPGHASIAVCAAQSSTTPDALFAQAESQRKSSCADASVQKALTCIDNSYTYMMLDAANAVNPPAPDTPFSVQATTHFQQGLTAVIQFIGTGKMSAHGVQETLNFLNSEQSTFTTYFSSVSAAGIAKQKQQIIKDISDRINAEAQPIVGSEMTTLATDKQNALAAGTIANNYRSSVAALASTYTSIAQLYTAYRATEASTYTTLTQLAQTASTADINTLNSLQEQLLTLDGNETSLPEQLIMNINQLKGQLGTVQANFAQDIAPYAQFMATNNAVMPDATSVAINSLAQMYAYTFARENSLRTAISNIMTGLGQRIEALTLQSATSASQPSMLAAAQLAASTAFVQEATNRVSLLWQSGGSNSLGLPYLSAEYDRVTDFIGLQTTCSGANTPAYMQTGCKLLVPQFSKCTNWLNTGLASNIQLDLYFMGAKATAAQVAQVQADLASKNLALAVYDHDAILHGIDVTPAPDAGVTHGDGGISYVDEDE